MIFRRAPQPLAAGSNNALGAAIPFPRTRTLPSLRSRSTRRHSEPPVLVLPPPTPAPLVVLALRGVTGLRIEGGWHQLLRIY